ncbi:hypothetical protein N8T08_009488 [Aspergillus melleus]|uniref:Uncharacterized protein n=1 Tax=Aspergillus melleus TaxID=138277 RepID=A0ACC3BCW8_9EURO|nr:hypothetical protein N8T08_009488 [Aspergillus melleus]
MYHQRYADSPIVNAYIPTRRGDPYFQDMYLWVPVQRGRNTVSQFYTDMLRAIDRGEARISTSPSGSRAGSTWALAIDRQDVNNDRRIIRQFQNDIYESRQYAASEEEVMAAVDMVLTDMAAATTEY